LRLALESFGVVDELEQVLCVIRDVLGNANGVAMCTNLLVSREKTFCSLISSRSAVGTVELVAAGAFAESDAGLKLSTIEKGICAITNTRRVIIALVVVRKGTPLGSSIDDTITEDKTTGAADHVARCELLDKVWWKLLAVFADHV
jgi:hypothetical protein